MIALSARPKIQPPLAHQFIKSQFSRGIRKYYFHKGNTDAFKTIKLINRKYITTNEGKYFLTRNK